MLEPYQSETCQYCSKVREKLSEFGLSYVAHNPHLSGDERGNVTNEIGEGDSEFEKVDANGSTAALEIVDATIEG